jgi:ketosteroid isomerase-like protein
VSSIAPVFPERSQSMTGRTVPVLALAALVVALLALGQPGAPTVAQDATPAAADVEAVARQAIEALELAVASGDTSAIDAVFHAEFVNRTPDDVPPDQTEGGVEELKTAYTGIVTDAISDVAFTVDDVLVDGDMVAVRYTINGTLDPAPFGLPGEPRPVAIGGVHLMRIADGQVVENWDYSEFPEVLLEGAAPTEATPAP